MASRSATYRKTRASQRSSDRKPLACPSQNATSGSASSATNAVALVTGTIEHDGIRFVRPTVHVFHVRDGQVTEFWEASLDQHAEDDFWRRALTATDGT
jgi:ketosteroid isomerase-like protein